MKIAVIGAGIFGCTAAFMLAREGHKVTLFEERDDILRGASGHNQFRIHSGYHYPRSPETIEECIRSRAGFMTEYGNCVVFGAQHHFYGIANGSKTKAEEWEQTMRDHDLMFQPAGREGIVDLDTVTSLYRVPENWVDIDLLRKVVAVKLDAEGVDVKLGTKAGPETRPQFDRVVVATYDKVNETARSIPAYEANKIIPLQFEMVEKPIVWFEDSALWKNTGIVIMDGDYPCIDPYGPRDAMLLSHVKYAIHRRSVGEDFKVPYYIEKEINAGIVNARFSHFEDMRDDGAFYIPGLREAHHIGSFYTIRAVRPDVDATDERLTSVEYIDKDKGIIRIFSGKMSTAVDAALKVRDLL